MRRDFRGPSSEKLAGARQGLWLMDHRPEEAFRCGPMALMRIGVSQDPSKSLPEALFKSRSTTRGMSFPQVVALSREIGMPMKMAKREAGAVVIVPAVVHWKLGHFSALLAEQKDEVRVDDSNLADQLFVRKSTLDSEASGYFLVAENVELPAGWRLVEEEEGREIWGKGQIQISTH